MMDWSGKRMPNGNQTDAVQAVNPAIFHQSAPQVVRQSYRADDILAQLTPVELRQFVAWLSTFPAGQRMLSQMFAQM